MLRIEHLLRRFVFRQADKLLVLKTELGRFIRMTDFVDKQQNVANSNLNTETTKRRKAKNQKYCLLLSYCGQEYHGMQRNTGFDTIENQLFLALYKSEVINKDAFLNPREIHFQRAARTDKHVSAIRQIVSLQLPGLVREQINKVNSELPNDIKIIDFVKTIPSFDAKNYCDARTYIYLMPTFALMQKDKPIDKGFQVDEETLTRFENLLKKYIGSNRFHNFTSGKTAAENSSRRVIRLFECGKPFYPLQNEKKEIEFIVVRVKGQSFVLHQIRKMVGLAIAIIRGFDDDTAIERAFETDRMNVPIAPGVNLMLEQTHFDWYNRKHAYNGPHQPIAWDHVCPEIDKFKEEFIYPIVLNAELQQNSMVEWLSKLDYHYQKNSEEQQALNQQSKVLPVKQPLE